MWAWTLLGQAVPGRRDPFQRPEVIWGTVGLMAVLLVGAFCVWVVDRWRKKTLARPDAKEELTDFRAMYERGEITEAEYFRLRDRVAERVKQSPTPTTQQTGTTPNPAGPGGTPPPAPPPPPPGPDGDWPGASV
jgi:hypothetical protein